MSATSIKELTIHHSPAEGDAPSRVRVTYRPEPGAQVQVGETEFRFSVGDDEHRQIQWYLEEYLLETIRKWTVGDPALKTDLLVDCGSGG